MRTRVSGSRNYLKRVLKKFRRTIATLGQTKGVKAGGKLGQQAGVKPDQTEDWKLEKKWL